MANLSTNTEKIEAYNKAVEAKEEPIKKDISEAVLSIALGAARSEVFPPFGLISFNEDQGKDDKSINELADQTIKGTKSFYDRTFVNGGANNLLHENAITNSPIFKGSKAVTELEAKTRAEYSKILSIADNKAEDEAEGIKEDKFENKDLNKFDGDSLKNILSATMVDFIREIGIKRDSNIADDNFQKSRGDKLLNQIENKEEPAAIITSSPSTITNTVEAPKIENADTEKNTAPAQIEPQPIKIESIGKETMSSNASAPQVLPIITPPVTVSSVSPINNTQTNVTNTSNSSNINNVNNASVRNGTTSISNKNTSSIPNAVTSSSPTPLSTLNQSAAGEGSITSALFASLGIKNEEAQAILNKGTATDIQSGIEKTFSSESPIISSSPVPIAKEIHTKESSKAQIKNESATPILSANTSAKMVKEEPIKLATQSTQKAPVKDEKEEVLKESTTKEISKEEKPKEETIASNDDKKINKELSDSESSKKEEGNINRQILIVMSEILKTLQGPLLVSEDKPRFL